MKNLDKTTNVIGVALLFVVCAYCIFLTKFALEGHITTTCKISQIVAAWFCFGGIVWLIWDTITQITKYIWHKVKRITFDHIVILMTIGAIIAVDVLWVNEMVQAWTKICANGMVSFLIMCLMCINVTLICPLILVFDTMKH